MAGFEDKEDCAVAFFFIPALMAFSHSKRRISLMQGNGEWKEDEADDDSVVVTAGGAGRVLTTRPLP